MSVCPSISIYCTHFVFNRLALFLFFLLLLLLLFLLLGLGISIAIHDILHFAHTQFLLLRRFRVGGSRFRRRSGSNGRHSIWTPKRRIVGSGSSVHRRSRVPTISCTSSSTSSSSSSTTKSTPGVAVVSVMPVGVLSILIVLEKPNRPSIVRTRERDREE